MRALRTGEIRYEVWPGPYLTARSALLMPYFAPAVFRFNAYGVKCSPVVADYLKTMLAHLHAAVGRFKGRSACGRSRGTGIPLREQAGPIGMGTRVASRQQTI